ncbi:hypothetical protein S7711_08259 [Stachybotrys chartarum IBT 7711]|jgi:hypothetical protein|uniref:Infection structure specific protein n=1 Tax=Stachybotrys chartarum (strain CBS 109288 / IBT 7711) TaxID=1280523 RepID=A0A084AQK7_STACB|nr:hypothetical protein S7711_08259 [Stachybotrys chartarum IBT 7711]KFA56237.1 hypothetical protein S40293_00173 [Stachybotrys chartarum IBT 40293]KFA72041.1 hypothetical protein S40288_02273 [Stachybotrys chartarum IBT 40288]
MSVQKLLLLAGVSAVALAGTPSKRDIEECMSLAEGMLPDLLTLPTPDDSLASFIAEQTQLATATDACVIPAVTGSMAEEYSSWASDLSSWQVARTDDLSSLYSACTDVPEISSSLAASPAMATICDEITWESPAASSENEDSNDSNDDSDDNDSESENTTEGGDGGSSATRQSVGVIGAIFAAGLVAVAAL